MPRPLLALVLCFLLPAYAADPVESLHTAAKNGDVDNIRKLIAGGVNVDAVKNGGTPLLTATNWNNYEAAKVLIALKADVNFKVGQWTPLIRAVGRDTRIVKLLIDSGADVNYADPVFGTTALSSAVNNRPETFKQLAKTGSYVGPFPNTSEAVTFLINAGANVNHKDRSGKTPLRIAVSSNNTNIVRLLLKAGADVNEHNPAPGVRTYTGSDDPVLFDAVSGYPRTAIQITNLLLEAGADPNYRNFRPYDAGFDMKGKTTDGYTALTFSARWGYLPLVELLLKHGADPCMPREDGALASSIAEKHNHLLVAKVIREQPKECAP